MKKKPLTIEQVKELQIGDWVWVIRNLDSATPCSHYGEIEGYGTIALTHAHEYLFVRYHSIHNLKYSDYGSKWVAYKNKEDAERVLKTCSNCIYYQDLHYEEGEQPYIKHVCELFQRQMQENDYCSNHFQKEEK